MFPQTGFDAVEGGPLRHARVLHARGHLREIKLERADYRLRRSKIIIKKYQSQIIAPVEWTRGARN